MHYMTTHPVHDHWLVVITRFVQRTQHFLQMLSNVIFLVQQQLIQQLSRLDASFHDPVREVARDARQYLGEVMVHECTAAEVRPFHWNKQQT